VVLRASKSAWGWIVPGLSCFVPGTGGGRFSDFCRKARNFRGGARLERHEKTTRQNTDRRASHGMLSFIVVLFITALAIAGLYFFVFTPEKQQGQPAPHAINQSQ